ncbi:MAG: 4Fe-4S binding protein [Desulfobacterales bacterium]|jgi:Pyruvate/2-oxoacid:ferredoxin oxidoreductase delta subunit|nr:4Fe-4S binding protein [Desulfobacteraceae bacterium]MBT4365640.1 4Fe-4S binding protein [Desulfobacteraceae bacterium]MBT7086047.1 4Fe-4S binding protein [Desulfobacterales bacterium]MBT7697326.1 4Fe-4S binding protein [Desulfobacterales bacterium]
MSNDLYIQLGERLNEGNVKMPLSEKYMALLKEYYTSEHALIAANFPKESETAAQLSKKFDRDEKKLVVILEDMADNGLLFTDKNKNGEYLYTLQPFFPGVLELTLMRGGDTPRDRKRAKMMTDFQADTLEIMKYVQKKNKDLSRILPPDAVRTITIEEELPESSEIFSYDRLTELINMHDSFAASICYCRHHKYLDGEPCSTDGIPKYSCVSLGKGADYIVDRNFGKRISKDECLEIMKVTENAGLVHNVNNNIGDTGFVCNCCSCCCGLLETIKALDSKGMLTFSNFEVSVDEELCVGCEECVERCPLDALSVEEDVVSVNRNICVGCGVCNSVCSVEALSMVERKEHHVPAEVTSDT